MKSTITNAAAAHNTITHITEIKTGKTYDGTKDNSEKFRPLLGLNMIIPSAKKTAGKNITVYKLVNILTNKGRYDTYVLENTRTGKIKKSKYCQEITTIRKTEFTKEEVYKLVLSQEWKTAEKFIKLIKHVENNSDDIAAWRELIEISICDNHTAKTAGLLSIDTSCIVTCSTNTMRLNPECICYYCFSESQQECYITMRDKLIRNAYLYCFHDIPADAFPLLNTLYFRFECFGDLMNSQQLKNYLKMIRKNPRTTFTEWTKKPWIMSHVFKTESKPENMIVVLSAPKINDTMTYEQARAAWPFIDKLFTVYTKEYAAANNIEINCGMNICMNCRRCYELNNNVKHIKEIKK